MSLIATNGCDDHSWELRAKCNNKAFELFEYQEHDSPLAKGMTFTQRMEFNEANFDRASEICIECPVMFQCLDAADTLDRAWTVRGGLMPTMMASAIGRYSNHQGNPGKPGVDRICGRGHLVEGGGRCKECKKIHNDKRARLQAASTSHHRDGVN